MPNSVTLLSELSKIICLERSSRLCCGLLTVALAVGLVRLPAEAQLGNLAQLQQSSPMSTGTPTPPGFPQAPWQQSQSGSAQPSFKSAPVTANTLPSASSALKVESATQKVARGTMLTVAFITPMDSRLTNVGDVFTARLSKDFTVVGQNGEQRMILPEGTLIRGRVDQVKRPALFSHGGAIYLAFDHVVLPSGELLPLTLNLSTENTRVNQKGALYSDPGIGKKVQLGAEEGRKTFSNFTDQGYQTGKQIAGGLGSLVTVPASVIGGALAGTAVTTGRTAVAIVGRGDSVVIKPGDTVTIDFGGSFNLPSQ